MFDRIRHLLLVVMCLLATGFMLSCSGGGGGGSLLSSGGSKGDATLTVRIPSGAQKPQMAMGTAANIASVTVDVKNGSTIIVSSQTLVYENGAWAGTVHDLPVGPTLTFIIHAYNSAMEEIFTGTTAQALSGGADTVTVSLAPASGGTTGILPRINQVIVPAEITVSETVDISVSIEGNSDEQLTYSTAAAPNGGTFGAPTGSITLGGTSATLVLSYSAPATAGTYTHTLTVTNSQGNWVATDIVTNVVPASAGDIVVDIQFNPVITSLGGKRNGSDVVFTATVSDDGPASELVYEWFFDGGLTFFDSTSNPAVLQGYDQSVSGNVTVTVTDHNGTGGSTSASLHLAPGAFPDPPDAGGDTTPPTAPVGLTATPLSASQIILDWPAAASTDDVAVIGYTIYRNGAEIVSVPSLTTAHHIVDGNLVSNVSYCYTLKAYDQAGNVSDPSAEVCSETIDAGLGILAALSSESRGIAVDATSVYWGEYSSSGAIKKVGINDGTVTTLASGISFPHAIAVDATNVYWVEWVSGDVKKVPINGGSVTTIASNGLGRNPQTIAVDATSVYWGNGATGTINKVSIDGGAVSTIASGNNPSGIVLDAENVYWSENVWPIGVVRKVGKNGGTMTSLITETMGQGLAMDSGFVYVLGVSTTSGEVIQKVGKDGGSPAIVASTTSGHGSSLIKVDSTNVYWADTYGNIKTVSKDGGDVATLMNANRPILAIDGTNVYVVDNDVMVGVKLMKMAK